jgi:hypothetical protein
MIFLSGARPALSMGVTSEAIMGCLQPIIGSKLLRLIFSICLDNSSPYRNYNVLAMTWLLIVFWFDRTLTDAHGQCGKIPKVLRVNGFAASALHATSQPTFFRTHAYLRENSFLFIVILFLPFGCRHLVFFLVPILPATLHSRKRSVYLCTSRASLIHSNDKALNQETDS